MGCTRVAGRTVLVIDDDDGVRSTIPAGLEALGLRALVAADAEAGLQLLKTSEPDLVFCDLQMPELDGFGFMARVRETPSLDGMPIVALSGQGSLADIARSQALGFRAHLVKPLSLDVLRRLLEVLLERLDLRDTAPSSQADLPVLQPTTFELVINLKTAKALASRTHRRC